MFKHGLAPALQTEGTGGRFFSKRGLWIQKCESLSSPVAYNSAALFFSRTSIASTLKSSAEEKPLLTLYLVNLLYLSCPLSVKQCIFNPQHKPVHLVIHNTCSPCEGHWALALGLGQDTWLPPFPQHTHPHHPRILSCAPAFLSFYLSNVFLVGFSF